MRPILASEGFDDGNVGDPKHFSQLVCAMKPVPGFVVRPNICNVFARKLCSAIPSAQQLSAVLCAVGQVFKAGGPTQIVDGIISCASIVVRNHALPVIRRRQKCCCYEAMDLVHLAFAILKKAYARVAINQDLGNKATGLDVATISRAAHLPVARNFISRSNINNVPKGLFMHTCIVGEFGSSRSSQGKDATIQNLTK